MSEISRGHKTVKKGKMFKKCNAFFFYCGSSLKIFLFYGFLNRSVWPPLVYVIALAAYV